MMAADSRHCLLPEGDRHSDYESVTAVSLTNAVTLPRPYLVCSEYCSIKSRAFCFRFSPWQHKPQTQIMGFAFSKAGFEQSA